MSHNTAYEVCNCICHHVDGVHHIVACCHRCHICKQNIKSGLMDQHLKHCAEDRAKLVKEYEELVNKAKEGDYGKSDF